MVTQTHPRGDRSVPEKVKFEVIFGNFQVPLNNVNIGNFGAFRGAHRPGYMGSVATTVVPIGAQVRVCSG